MTELNLIITTLKEEIKFIQSNVIYMESYFKDFEKQLNLIEIKEMRKAKNSLIDCVKASLKAFAMTLKSLQLEYINSIDIFVNFTLQILFDVGSFERFQFAQINLKRSEVLQLLN